MALKLHFNILFLTFALSAITTLGHSEVTCEQLDQDTCAFAVSATGKRCVLEKTVRMRTGTEAFTCRSSEIEADNVKSVVETDDCVKACGLDRRTFGISSDALLDPRFTHKLCSDSCYNSCPNIVDLFFNLAAGEGVYLPKFCKAQKSKGRRELSEMRSSGVTDIAEAPTHGYVLSGGISPAPESQPPYPF